MDGLRKGGKEAKKAFEVPKDSREIISAEVLVEIRPLFEYSEVETEPKPGFDNPENARPRKRRAFRVFLQRTKGMLADAYEILAIEDLGEFARPSLEKCKADAVPPAAQPANRFSFPNDADGAVTPAARREITAQLKEKHGIDAQWPTA